MKWIHRHDWPTSKSEAYDLEESRLELLSPEEPLPEPSVLAAVEATYGHGAESIFAAAAVMTFPELEPIERALCHLPVTFPYIPGLFYYREGPVLVEVLRKLTHQPDVILVSGHGRAHPRRLGLACQIGISFDTPSIGCARRLLIGRHQPVAEKRGHLEMIVHRGDEIGVAYRSKDKVKPIFISAGHRCDTRSAAATIEQTINGFRLPEPLRLVHNLANRHKRNVEKTQQQPAGDADESRKDLA